MYCASCGRQQADRARFCTTCGAPITSNLAYPAAPGASVPPAGAWPRPATGTARFGLDIKRLGTGDFIVGGATVALMIGIFLPWFEFGSTLTGYFSFDSTSLRSWMYLTFFIALAIVAYLALKAVWPDFRLPLPHWFVLLAACGADLFVTLVCFATKPVGLSWDFGAYFSVLAAAVAVVGTLVCRNERVAPTRSASSGAVSGPAVPCRTCRQPNPVTSRFCDSCGHALHR